MKRRQHALSTSSSENLPRRQVFLAMWSRNFGFWTDTQIDVHIMVYYYECIYQTRALVQSMTFVSQKKSILSRLRTSHNLRDIAQDQFRSPTVGLPTGKMSKPYITVTGMTKELRKNLTQATHPKRGIEPLSSGANTLPRDDSVKNYVVSVKCVVSVKKYVVSVKCAVRCKEAGTAEFVKSEPAMDYEEEQEHVQRLINEVFSEKQPEERTGGDSSDNEEDHVSENEHDTSTEISADSSESDDETSDIDCNVIFGKDKTTEWKDTPRQPRNVRTRAANIVTHLPRVKGRAKSVDTPSDIF
ncbi:hypothetical protein ANN_14148 [Periplaneta americana]|uniref:Uncharacterized protein n=1 Tax=Periplaneta americana TaxID=6978 RepID=A0ABQ8SVH9_PERAM|nr:hypothetical protein ANN_14148 [Periplaneta americana]